MNRGGGVGIVGVIVIVLVRLRVVSLEKLRSIRSYVIVGAFVIGAIFSGTAAIRRKARSR